MCTYVVRFEAGSMPRITPTLRDMVMLADTDPDVYEEFMKDNFVAHKSVKKFSLVAKDQSQEQSNKGLQAQGGTSGLCENPRALALFMLA